MNYESGICYYCKADENLHHADDNSCPANGPASGDVGATGWMTTTFTDSGLKRVADNSTKVLAAAQEVVKQCKLPVTYSREELIKKLAALEAAIADSLPPETKK